MRLRGNSQKMRFRGYSVRSVMPLLLFVILVICAFSLPFFSSVARFINFVSFLFDVDYWFSIFYFIYICSNVFIFFLPLVLD